MFNYKNYISTNITTNSMVYNPIGYSSTIIGFIVCNNTANSVNISVTIINNGVTANIASNVTISTGASLSVVDSNRIIVGDGNSIYVSSTGSVDVTISVIEVLS